MPIVCMCGKLIPQTAKITDMRLKSAASVLCNQCIKTQELLSAINSLALNQMGNISKYSTHGAFSTQWNGNTLLPIVPSYMTSTSRIIASGISVIYTPPIYTSFDGVSEYTPISKTEFCFTETSKIVFNGHLYVTSARGSDISLSKFLFSTDGVKWLESDTTVEDTVEDISSDGFTWLAITKKSGIMSSSDGKSWNPIINNIYLDTCFSNCEWTGTEWLISGYHKEQNCIYTSSDKITWNLLGHIPSQTTFMKYNSKILLIGYKNSPFIQYSLNNGTNLINSLSALLIFPSGCNDVAWNGSLWIAVGPGVNTIATSKDGIVWTGLGNSIFTEAGNSICWNTTYWVAGGSGTNSLAYSINGVDWIGLGTKIFTKVTSVCSAFIKN